MSAYIDHAEQHRRLATSWACMTIQRQCPHLRLEATDNGLWRLWWRDEGTGEIPFEDGAEYDWRGLCAIAKGDLP